MHRFMAWALILSLCLLSLGAFAQENRIVRVGVAIMQNRATRSVPGNLKRDRLVAALNQQKPDKKLHVKVQGIPLDGMTPDEVASQAADSKCDYVVYTTLIELSAKGDPGLARPGPIQTSPGTIQTNPNQWNTAGNQPEYRATVEYRLYRTGNSNAISGAPFSNQQAMPETEVVSQVMNQIANRVFSEVKKAPPAMQE